MERVKVKKTELENAGYEIRETREQEKVLYEISLKGDLCVIVSWDTKKDFLVIMNEEKFTFCDNVKIELDDRKVVLKYETIFPQGKAEGNF